MVELIFVLPKIICTLIIMPFIIRFAMGKDKHVGGQLLDKTTLGYRFVNFNTKRNHSNFIKYKS